MPRLADIDHCTGCTACASSCNYNCISMLENSEGFLYPSINNEKCINCKRCERACPVLNRLIKSDYAITSCASNSKDDSVRNDSSSGGVFTELATAVLQKGGIVYGAAYDANYRVSHIAVSDTKQLGEIRGAKYSQSNLQGIFNGVKENLNSNKLVLFSGTSCQVEGLKCFLGKEYDNLITVDFVCHGVPSPLAWKEYVKYRSLCDNNGEMPISINMRSKHTGWTNYQYSNLYKYSNCEYSAKSGDDLFMQLFVGDYINRKSCSTCAFKGYKRNSDITLGDFWGIWDIQPDMDDNKGTSLVIIQSSKGEKLFEECSRKLKVLPVKLSQTSLQNPSLIRCSKANPKRDVILQMIVDGKIGDSITVLNKDSSSMKGQLISIIYRIARKIKG